MARSLEAFEGRFKIRNGGGVVGGIQRGDYLCIGTGEDGALKSDGVRTGISIVSGESGRRIVPALDDPPAFAYLVDGSLNGDSFLHVDTKLVPMVFQVAMLEMRTPQGSRYRSPTLSITLGDPYNAGVWGADDESDTARG